MNDLFHIHLPCSDDDITELEKFLCEQFGRPIKFQRLTVEMIDAEQVKVNPMSSPNNLIDFMELKYK